MSNSKRIISLTVVCLFALAAIIVNRAATRALSFTQTPQPAPKSQQDREALAKKPAPSPSGRRNGAGWASQRG